MTGSPASPDWTQIVENATPAIVELRVNYVRPFDGEAAGCGVGTGFVVDKSNGFILTNRHVVSSGPVTATAHFSNKKRINCIPVYRDPVHDFGFFKYDPKDIASYGELTEIHLNPAEARIGMDFRIIGSGESEQNSIIPGTLASLTRNAPRYQNFWDFNTFYFAAVSNAKSGSSGSPILGPSGDAIAINAGGSAHGAASFFLPLDRIVYALQRLQSGEDVPRGTVLAIFEHKTFDEIEAQGVRSADIDAVRKHFDQIYSAEGLPKDEVKARGMNPSGLLVVSETVPDGPADVAGILPGDVVLKVNDEHLHQFLPLQNALDSFNEVNSVKFEVIRNGEHKILDVHIDDLYTYFPSEYMEVGGAMLHPYSFTMAIRRNIPMKKGLFLANGGYMFKHAFIQDGVIIKEINGSTIETLDDLERIVDQLADKQKVVVKFYVRRNDDVTKVMTMDKAFFPICRSLKNDQSGKWEITDLTTRLEHDGDPLVHISHQRQLNSHELEELVSDRVQDSLVTLEVRSPLAIEGAVFSKTMGNGVIVSLNPGLIVASRRVVFSPMVDIVASIQSLFQFDARLVYLHPTKNIAIIEFDPHQLLGKGVKVHVAQLNRDPLIDPSPGDRLLFHGLTAKEEPIQQNCSVTGREIPFNQDPLPPRFISRNEQFLVVDQLATLYQSVGGIFVGETGLNGASSVVSALWMGVTSEARNGDGGCKAVSALEVASILDRVMSRGIDAPDVDEIQSLGVVLQSMAIGRVREAYGLSDEWVKKLVNADPKKQNQVLIVRKVLLGSKPATILKQNDLLIEIDGLLVPTLDAFESAIGDKLSVNMTIVSEGSTKELMNVPTERLKGFQIRRVVSIDGMILHSTHDAVKFSGFTPSRGGSNVEGKYEFDAYLTASVPGSPAYRGKVYKNGWIVKVNGKETRSLEDVVSALVDIPDGEYISIEHVSLTGAVQVLSLQNDVHYFPPSQVIFKEGQWKFEGLI